MEKYSIEIETAAGWVTYHTVMRPGRERAASVLAELQEQFPTAKFRIVQWSGAPLGS